MEVNDIPEFEFKEETNMFAADDALKVRFFHDKKKNPQKSLAAGYDTHDQVEMVEIVFDGGKSKKVEELLSPERYPNPAKNPKLRFAKQYQAFKKNANKPYSGIPLDEWKELNVAQVADFRARNIETVEQLAALSDADIQSMMGGLDLRKKAKTYIDALKAEAPGKKLAEENIQLRADYALLKEQLQNLTYRFERENTAKLEPKRGPGRPPKQLEETNNAVQE